LKTLWLIALSVPLISLAEGPPAFQQRVKQVIESHAAQDPGGLNTVAARLYLKRDAEWCSRRLMELLRDPTGDMFWMFPVTAIAYLNQNQLTPAATQALRDTWRTYMPFRGDTENHWLLYYTSLYLMSQLYPGQPAESWFTGKSSTENFREAETYLLHWMRLTATIGQGEYDCTHYIGVYLLPLSYLAQWAQDEKMRTRARKMLDWIIADYAVENLNGIYVGAHARTDDVQVLEKWHGVSSDFGWLLFGLGYPQPGFASYALYYSVASAYEPPEVIQRIATDRSQPYVHLEKKRTRHRWRFSDERNAPVYKTTFMHRDYAVGSDQGGILQPIQQHSWDVTWALDDPRGKRNTIFSLHPYSSPYELQMYFTGMPDFITEAVVRSKRTYDSPDKFLGGSPYEQIWQDRDTVIALYDIPAGTRFPHINGFFPEDLNRFEEHESGWIFAHGGNAYIAYRPLAPYEWKPVEEGGKRLFSPHLKNGTILQAASASEFASFDAFRKTILALPLEIRLNPAPSVRFRTLRGRQLNCTFGEARDFSNRKMFEGPYLNADVGSRRLVLTHGALRYEVDLSGF
jgi:hypothetical protein